MTASLFINIQGKKTSKINYCHLFLQRALLNNDKNFEQFEGEAESFMCRILPNSPYKTTQYTQGKTTSLSLLYIYIIFCCFQHLKFYSTQQFHCDAGGLMYKLPESNLQYVTSITFLLTTYAKYMKATRHTFNCGNLLVTPNSLLYVAKRQASYKRLLFFSMN
jgi:hypothetical protein